MDYEGYLRAMLHEIERRARAEAQPYIDELARLEALRPPRPMIIPKPKGA